jgi:hypothetical protein
VQARVSELCALTRLDVSGIRTPVESPTLHDVFARLPALQSVCLAFRPTEPIYDTNFDSDSGSDSDSEFEGPPRRRRTQQHGFPESLLRCQCSHTACRAATQHQMQWENGLSNAAAVDLL